MNLYVLSIITISTDIYNVENEVIVKKTEEEARESLRDFIKDSKLDISISDDEVYVNYYIEGVGSFYASITKIII